jgi:hypothetical protein
MWRDMKVRVVLAALVDGKKALCACGLEVNLRVINLCEGRPGGESAGLTRPAILRAGRRSA